MNQGVFVPPLILPPPVIDIVALKPIKRALFGVEARDQGSRLQGYPQWCLRL